MCHNSQELIKGYKVANECSPTGSVICEKFVKNKGLVVFYSFYEWKNDICSFQRINIL